MYWQLKELEEQRTPKVVELDFPALYRAIHIYSLIEFFLHNVPNSQRSRGELIEMV